MKFTAASVAALGSLGTLFASAMGRDLNLISGDLLCRDVGDDSIAPYLPHCIKLIEKFKKESNMPLRPLYAMQYDNFEHGETREFTGERGSNCRVFIHHYGCKKVDVALSQYTLEFMADCVNFGQDAMVDDDKREFIVYMGNHDFGTPQKVLDCPAEDD